MSLLSQIESNEITHLTLEASPKEALEKAKPEKLVLALEKNTSITCVVMKADFLGCLRGDVRSQVLHSLTNLPKLQTLVLGNSLVLVPNVTGLVKSSKSLNSLSLDAICLQGGPALVEELQAALSSSTTLKEFHLSENCMASNQSVDLDALRKVKAGAGGCGTPIYEPTSHVDTATAA